MLDLAGRVFAVSGAASGIGFATAELLAQEGASVSICDVDEDGIGRAYSSLKKFDGPVLAIKADVSNAGDVRHWISETIRVFGRLDGAANVAGIIGKIHGVNAVGDMDEDEWDRIMAVNLKGTMLCMREQINGMNSAVGGSVVNVSSIHGLMGFARHSAYNASKHAILGLTRSAAKEYGEKGIRINAIAPGEISTPMMAKSTNLHGDQAYSDRTALRRPGSPKEVASAIGFLLSESSSYITGATLSCDGGWNC